MMLSKLKKEVKRRSSSTFQGSAAKFHSIVNSRRNTATGLPRPKLIKMEHVEKNVNNSQTNIQRPIDSDQFSQTQR